MDNVLVKQQMINNVNSAYIDKYKLNWFNIVNLEHSRNSTGGNKLRTYKLFKDSFSTESYCTMILPLKSKKQRSRILSRYSLWLRLRRYLIVFDPPTFVLD